MVLFVGGKWLFPNIIVSNYFAFFIFFAIEIIDNQTFLQYFLHSHLSNLRSQIPNHPPIDLYSMYFASMQDFTYEKSIFKQIYYYIVRIYYVNNINFCIVLIILSGHLLRVLNLIHNIFIVLCQFWESLRRLLIIDKSLLHLHIQTNNSSTC